MSITKRVTVYGIVQGVGFRPFVKRLADELGLTGTVANKGSYVEIFISGDFADADSFITRLRTDAPSRALIYDIKVTNSDIINDYSAFDIIDSTHEAGEILIPADIAICDNCLRELFDKKNRRYHHPFINCTDCGPRLTILKSMPYDRIRTTMSIFPFCPTCEKEYFDPYSRRFDAQPVCCTSCGPRLEISFSSDSPFIDSDMYDSVTHGKDEITDNECITLTASIINRGGIAAIKGIGGFHLVCNATDSSGIDLLRRRKNRPMKPLAVMCKNLEAVKKYCDISQNYNQIQKLLDSPEKPIVLLKKNSSQPLPDNLAPNNNYIGVLLPYTPLHHLLFLELETDIIVMTSGNRSGSPIARDNDEAFRLLGDLCDVTLTNNRDILIRADDSVIELQSDGTPLMIRRSRGYAPLPIIYSPLGQKENPYDSHRCILSLGGELKNSFCVTIGAHHYMSPYIGDMSNADTLSAAKETIFRFLEMLECEPDLIAIDAHPDYNSSKLGLELAKEMNCSVTRVQHHFAHVMSCIAENNLDINTTPVMGLSCDGTGYGLDNTIWGSELIEVNSGEIKRLSSLPVFRLIGGDSASKDAWKSAISLILDNCSDSTLAKEKALEQSLCTSEQFDVLLAMHANNINTIFCSSLGRRFDAKSAELGLCHSSSYEGEAATTLMYAAQLYASATLNDSSISADTAQKAFLFHEEIAKKLTAMCIAARDKNNINSIVLSGGCFVNTLLLELTTKSLKNENFTVYTHHLIPSNDGGIALGQAIISMTQ